MTTSARILSISRFAWFLALLFAILALSGCGGGNSDTSYASSPELDRAVASLRSGLEKATGKTVPSLSVLIQTPEGAYFSSTSAVGERRVTPHTYFRFASTTKNFTATAILKMHQDGWLNYMDRIVNLIPGSAVPYVPNTPAWNIPYKDRITIATGYVISTGEPPTQTGECLLDVF